MADSEVNALKRLGRLRASGRWFMDALDAKLEYEGPGRYDPGWFHPSDFGHQCFQKDTLIWTIDGPIKIKDLVGKEPLVLTVDNYGKMTFRRMFNIHQTKLSSVLKKINIRQYRKKSIGYFIATPDHKVFLKDGSEVFVENLKPGDRLSSVYRRIDGYFNLENSFGDSDREHRIIYAKTGTRPDASIYSVHHIDHNKYNNSPNNLMLLTKSNHSTLHMSGDNNPMRTWYPNLSEEEKEIYLSRYKNHFGNDWGKNLKGIIRSEETKSKISIALKGKQKSPEHIEKMRLANLGKKHSKETRAKMSTSHTGKPRNHFVVSIENVPEEPVYNGTVEEFHRFYIQTEENGGVLVRNCDAYLAFKFLGAPAKQKVNARLQRIFDLGNARDEALKTLTKKAGISLIKKEEDRKILLEQYRIRGELDDWVQNPVTGNKYVVDYKTMNNDEWQALDSVKSSHHLQVHPYEFAKETQEGFVLYENKNTQEWKVMPANFAYETWNNEIVQRVDRILSGIKAGYVKRTPISNESSCPFFDICSHANIPRLLEQSGVKL